MSLHTSLKLVFGQLTCNLVLDNKLMFQEACTQSLCHLTTTEIAAREREVLEAFANDHAKTHVGFTEEGNFPAGLKRRGYREQAVLPRKGAQSNSMVLWDKLGDWGSFY